MFPTLIRIGHLSISTYGVIIALATFAAGAVAARGFRERQLDADQAWSLVIYGLLGGFTGAKIYYVLLQGDLTALWSRSGFVWYGGLIGGGAAIALAVWRKGLPFWRVADAFAPALALGHGIGHVGCFFSGDSYGLPSNLPWAVAFARGAPPSTAGNLRRVFGVEVPASVPDSTLLTVHPTMLYSALALVLVFALLWVFRHRSQVAGVLFGVFLLFEGGERFLVEFLRAKDDRLLWGFTTAQAIAVLAVLGGVVVLMNLRRQRARPAIPLAYPHR